MSEEEEEERQTDGQTVRGSLLSSLGLCVFVCLCVGGEDEGTLF